MLGIKNNSPGIGDKIQFSSLPENYFRSTGEKVVDMDRCWVFDYNPFVVRDGEVTKEINLWELKLPQEHRLSQQERFSEALEIKTFLRHPRLYRFEDDFVNPKTVVVHTNGKSVGGVMSDAVIEQIVKTYKDYRIFQVGGPEDRDTPFISRKGLDLWESARLIATSEIFIGVNSSMMNIARCYPRVRRKVLVQGPHLDLTKFYPSSIYEHWIDYGWEYFNNSPDDIGVTMSFTKL